MRAFEAAGRAGSMRQAAAELFVTPGAISQQIRILEDHFGVPLFDRTPRELRFTEAGREFHAAAARHLRGLAQAAERVRPLERPIALSVAPDFAARWLMPRLGGFAGRYPKTEVRVDASFALADFERDDFDFGIRTLTSEPLDLQYEALLKQRVQPYCSPAYFRRLFKRGDPHRWDRVRLLHESQPYDLWTFWFARRGIVVTNTEAGLYFSHGQLAIVAAVEGEGVTLQPPEYVARELAQKTLVAADRGCYATGLRYYLVWPRRPLRAVAEAFKTWIIEAARAGASR